jgi:hypothetical protein
MLRCPRHQDYAESIGRITDGLKWIRKEAVTALPWYNACSIFLERLKNNMKTLRTAGVRTEHRSNTILERYRYTRLFGVGGQHSQGPYRNKV